MPGRSYNNGNTDSRFKFTGKELDQDLNINLYYFGARYYDPALGKWTSVDPLADEYPDMSPYNYCSNDPIFYKDPTGEALFAYGNNDDDLENSKKDLKTAAGDDADRISFDENNQIKIDTEGYEAGSNKALDLLISMNTATDSDGNAYNFGYMSDSSEPLTVSKGIPLESAVENLSKTPRRFGGKKGDGLVARNGFDGFVKISNKVDFMHKNSGKSVDRSQVVLHELSENYERTYSKKDVHFPLPQQAAHEVSNRSFLGGTKQDPITRRPKPNVKTIEFNYKYH